MPEKRRQDVGRLDRLFPGFADSCSCSSHLEVQFRIVENERACDFADIYDAPLIAADYDKQYKQTTSATTINLIRMLHGFPSQTLRTE